MGYLGKGKTSDLVFQLDQNTLKIGVPSGITIDTINVTNLFADNSDTDTLIVNSGATLPAFDVLSVNPTGNSSLGTVVQGTWEGSIIQTAYGGTGKSSYNTGDLLVGSGVSLEILPSGANHTYLRVGTTGLEWSAAWEGSVVQEAYGGTGKSTHASGSLLVGNGAGLNSLPSGSFGQVLKVGATGVEWSTDIDTTSNIRSFAVANSGSGYLASDADEIILLNGASGVLLPSLPTVGLPVTIKDRAGTATASPVPVSGNGNTIDGTGVYTIDQDYGFVTIVWDSVEWVRIG